MPAYDTASGKGARAVMKLSDFESPEEAWTSFVAEWGSVDNKLSI